MCRQHRKTCKRYNDPFDAHELTFSCYKQRPFLACDRTRNYLVKAIASARAEHAFHLWAFVIMPEYVHILIWFPAAEYSVSAALQSIKQFVSRRAIGYLRDTNPDALSLMATGQKDRPYRFWMDGGGYDRNITSRKATGASVEYIHNNPVVRGLCEYAEDWPWSSAAEWACQGTGPIPLDRDSLPTT